MQTLEKLITVNETDLDDLNHVNNVRYIEWANEIAKEHWLHNASDQMVKEYFWVMLSNFIEYKSSALLHDVVHLKTYIKKSEGVTSTRIVEMYHSETGKLLAKSETNWCFMNNKTKRPARVTPEINNLFN